MGHIRRGFAPTVFVVLTTICLVQARAFLRIYSQAEERFMQKMLVLLVTMLTVFIAVTGDAAIFTDNGNGTVTDSVTGLMWQQAEGGLMEWDKAVLYCTGLSLGGYSDWRLPKIKELESITDTKLWNPAINTAFFPKAYPAYYWSSTTGAYGKDAVWILGFSTGGVGSGNRADSLAYVRCVHGGRYGSADNLVLSVSKSGTGSGTVKASLGTLSWSGNSGKASYKSGASVTLTATADSGSTFTSWTGCDSTSADKCTVSMSTAKSVTATFGR